jgi:hypothetical protein
VEDPAQSGPTATLEAWSNEREAARNAQSQLLAVRSVDMIVAMQQVLVALKPLPLVDQVRVVNSCSMLLGG